MVAPSPLELRRRSPEERLVLALLRGGAPHSTSPVTASRMAPTRRPADADRQRLRELAIALVREGCAIQPPRAVYVHLDEVRLLHLVADVQAGRTLTGVLDPEKAFIAEIGTILAKTGIRLPGAAG